jgi:hypothetical protein
MDLVVSFLERINEIAAENDAEVLVVTLPGKREVRSKTGKMRWMSIQRDRVDDFAANDSNVRTLHTRKPLVGT